MSTPSIPAIPRPEHPRPDFHRGLTEGRDWVCLNGWWDFDFASKQAGKRKGWHRGEGELSRRIRVPFPWQSHAAWGTEDQAGNDNWFSREAFIKPDEVSEAERNYANAPQREVGWYRRTFRVPEAWQADGRRVFLNFGAADWQVAVWVNGKNVGEAESGYLPVSFDITDALAEPGEENLLVVRVYDPMKHKSQPVGKQYNWYTRTSGLWQTVWLEPRGTTHLAGLRFYPDPATGLVRVEGRLAVGEAAERVRCSVEIALGGQAIAQASVSLPDLDAEQEEASFALALQAPTVRLWSPDDPVLYDVTVSLQYTRPGGGRGSDQVSSYFGFRTITIEPLYPGGPLYLCLNGRPTYLRGNLNQSFNPWGVYTFVSDDDLRRDFEQALASGWNFIRLHIKLEDPRWYYWADRLGLLVMQDIPNFGYDGWSSKALQRWERTLRGAIERDFNHPSIIAWCLFNETWGLGGDDYKKSPDRQSWVESMYYLAKRLDPTRPVEDNSPCLYDHVITDINSWHFYINDYEQAAAHIRQVVEENYPGSGFNYCPGRYQRGEPLMNSEYGGISAGMGDADVSWCFRFLTNELRYYEQICGYVYTEQMDIEWEHNGFYNYDRTPKEFGYNPALLQGEQFLGITGPAGREVPAGEPASLRWWLRGPVPEGEARVVVRAQRLNAQAEMDGDWRETFAVGAWPLACLGEHELALPPELLAHPGLVWVWFELLDERSKVLAGNWAVLEVTGEPVLPAAAQVLDLGDVAAAQWTDPEIERGEYDGRVELLAGRGTGYFDFTLDPPDGARGLTVLAELSSARPRPGLAQTDQYTYPTDVVVSLNGEELQALPLGNQYADARGALSHMHGFAGRYGEPVRIEVPPDLLRKVLATKPEALVLRLAVPDDAQHPGGLTIYGPRAGRYPCGLTALWQV